MQYLFEVSHNDAKALFGFGPAGLATIRNRQVELSSFLLHINFTTVVLTLFLEIQI